MIGRVSKRFTKYPCEVCGKMVSNAGIGYAAHRRGKVCQAVARALESKEPGYLRRMDDMVHYYFPIDGDPTP